ncbi:MAG: putative cell-wall-anchored protein SasA motif, partial [Candidatus Solibacter sp.]|nr:putative cell-wall-anchored protein SasA motif [Candidatus Solibacter sp.]
ISMSFSNIQQLYNALTQNGYLDVQAKTLNLPSKNQLQSSDLTNLLANTAFFNAGTLAMTGVTAPSPTGSTIVISGVFQQSFLGQPNPGATAIFYLDNNGNAQLDHVVQFPAAWTFSSSFSGLAKTQIDELAFSAPSFVVASIANSLPTNAAPLAAGLNFSGALNFASGPVQPLAWLWNSPNLILTGGVTLPGSDNIPVMTLATPYQATEISIGEVSLNAGVSASSQDNSGTAVVSVSLTGQLNLGTKISIAISATIPEDSSQEIQLQIGSSTQPLASLNDLAALVSGQSLSAIIPSQIPLGNNLVLQDFMVGVVPASKTITRVEMTIGLVDLDWTLVPNLVQFQDILVTFTIAFPVSNPKLFAAVNATFTITSSSQQLLAAGNQPLLLDAPQADPAVIAIGTVIPGLVFTGGLASGTIDVIGAVAHFFGTTSPFDKTLNITELNFSIDVANKTYSLNATVDTSDVLDINLGNSLPIPPLQIENIKLALNRTPTGFGANLAATLEFLKNEWTVSAARSADANAGWTFSGMLNPNQELTIPDVVNSIIPASWGLTLPDDLQGPKITAFQASFSTAASTFSVSGTVAWTLTIVQGTLEFDVVASMALQSNRAKSSDPATYSGNLSADLKLNNIELQVQYAFAPNSSKFTFIFQAITAVYDNNQTKPSLTISFGNTTVGAILEFLIKLADPGASSKLSSPWDALNSISLNGLQIQIFFKTKSISISYPISLDLGFLTINKIGFTYSQLYGQGNIDLILDCKFLGQDYSGPNALSWNPTQSAPPATPGAGAALFDLQYLGLGQHVSLRNVSQLTTVTQVINALKNAVKPIGDPTSNPISQLPGLEFNSGSNWLLGAQFSIMGTFSMSLVFNDPDVYGLLIGLSGEKAGILAGLSFEILYRKVTDKIGVYHIDLKLPDAMRQLQFGQVSITLPVITVDIYTNGDFRFDFGFPTSPTDTSRCFQLQIFPFVGVGGFYFAKLSGATSSKVPKIDNGSFNPVIEAGIALFVGVGKTIQLGILSGGVSVTVNGIIQGVYASFEPTDKNVKSAPYFWLQGTIAIVGNVYATVDFGIIQANVSLTVYASVTLTVQVYEPILIQLQAGVTVSVSIKIIFIRISFHFSATISASFTIGSASTPPWHVVQGSGGGGQLAKASALRNARVAALRMSGPRTRPRLVALPRAMKVGAAAGSQDTVTLMFTPLITKAQASDLPGLTGSTDIVAISAMLFVDTAIDPGANSPAEAKLLAGAGANSGFNKLLKRLLQWSINTIGGQDTVVTLNELEELYKTLGKDSTFEDYFTYKSIGTFLSDNIIFQIDQRPTTTTVGAAFFPMIPELTLVTPNYKADFSGAPLVDDKYEQFIEQYFADLAVQFANSVERNPDDSQPQAPASAGADPVQESLPRWLFRRYFLMLSRGVVQAAIDFLNSYAYTVAAPDSESLDSIATQFDAVTLDYTSVQGDTLAIVAQKFSVTQPALMAANPGINWTPLAQGTALSIPIQVMVLYVTVGGDTLDSIAAHFGVTDSDVTMANPNVDFDKLTPGTELQIPVKVTAQSIVAANHSTTGLLRVWQTATAAARSLAAGAEQPVLSGIQYQVVSGDAIGGTGQTSIAQRFGITAPQLAANNLNVGGVFSPGASLSLGNIVYTTRTNDTLQSISTYFDLPVTSILADNPNPNIVLQSAQKLLIQNSKDETTSYTVAAGDTVESLVASQDTTIPSLLLLNAAILVQWDQAVNLTGVTHTAAGTFTVPYVVTPGDTLAGILTRYFGADTPAGENLLQQCNPDITDWKNIPNPATITFPIPDTIFSITQYYAVNVATFLTLNAANTNILAPRAVLTIPDISPAVASTDSFDSLSQRYDLTLEELATDLAATAGLFRDSIPEVGPAQITIPYVPAMKIDQLVSELGASDKINQSAAMTSRFMLHGLRIPEPQTTEVHARFMAGEHTLAESAQLQTFPVFALMGQEFPAPVSNSAGYTFTVNNPGGASWATLPDGKGGFSPSGTLAFPLSGYEQTQISDFQATEFQPQNMTVQRLPLSAYVADQVALQKEIVWQA